jgi:cadmium resistance protein CadD (predicted permease)
VFATTNIDDIVLLSLLFSDGKTSPRSIVAGQFLGIGALTLASAALGFAAVAIPPGWPALLGIIPLLLGVAKGVALLRNNEEKEDDPNIAKKSGLLAVASITIANGGDNLSVYIPLFASERTRIPIFAIVFAVMTAVWCAIGWKLVKNKYVGKQLQRYGRILLPIVLIALGLHLLSGARVLLAAFHPEE